MYSLALHLEKLKEPVAFVEHTGSFAFSNVLAMNVCYAPILSLRQQIENKLGITLNYLKEWDSKGEAHITVITPPEYDQFLSKALSMEEINEIARSFQIQNASFDVLGLGECSITIEEKEEFTFFVICKSERLLEIRRAISKRYLSLTGEMGEFAPEAYYPHITIGFTKRDLHENDGAIKDQKHSLSSRFRLELN